MMIVPINDYVKFDLLLRQKKNACPSSRSGLRDQRMCDQNRATGAEEMSVRCKMQDAIIEATRMRTMATTAVMI
jgi:hypothetical protein